MTITAFKPTKTQPASSPKQIWRGETFPCPTWQRGACDAYNGLRPQLVDERYIKGYCDQLKKLPTDVKGNVEWFRYRPDGGWKLTDNI